MFDCAGVMGFAVGIGFETISKLFVDANDGLRLLEVEGGADGISGRSISISFSIVAIGCGDMTLSLSEERWDDGETERWLSSSSNSPSSSELV